MTFVQSFPLNQLNQLCLLCHMKIRCFRDELQTSFDFIDSRRSQPTQPLSFNRHYIFVPFSNGIPVDSENIKLWNISYVKLEPWLMLHLTKNQLEKKINCSETVKTKLFFQICSCFRYYILWIWQNTTQTSTCPACANTAASVPSDLMTWRPALTVTTSFRPYHVHTTITHHTSFILVSHQSQTSPKCNEIILWKLQILSQLTAILITINNSLSRIVRLDAEILQLGH